MLLFSVVVAVLAAGFIAGGRAERPEARVALRLGAVVAAVALIVAPAVMTAIGNRQGIAWSVPAGERVELAEAGYAVTRDEDGRVVTARDLATGKQRWRRRLPGTGEDGGQFSVQRVGRTLLVHDRGGQLLGLDLASGRPRWSETVGNIVPPALASPEAFAFVRCDDGCVAEAHSVQDGRLLWRAGDRGGDGFRAAPRSDRDETRARPPWPSSIAVVRTRDRRFEVRDLASGRVLERGTRDDGATAVTGSTVVHAVFGGDLWATDARSGRELWRRKDDGDRASRSGDALLTSVGLPAGSVLLARHGDELPLLIAGDTLRLVDPRTGKLTETPNRLVGGVNVVDAPAPPVTAETAATGVPAGIPVLAKSFEGEAIQADGRVHRTADIQFDSVRATATQVGWESAQPVFLRDNSEDGAEVRDRRTGERVARYAGDEVSIRSVGERLVIVVGDDDRREYVVAA